MPELSLLVLACVTFTSLCPHLQSLYQPSGPGTTPLERAGERCRHPSHVTPCLPTVLSAVSHGHPRNPIPSQLALEDTPMAPSGLLRAHSTLGSCMDVYRGSTVT